jgi:hypothetical protein
MTKRREFIRESLIGTAGFAIGGTSFTTRLIASMKDSNTEIFSGPVMQPNVEVEEEVYQYVPADNGAGPMWCSGSTCLVRIGNRVFASGLETVADWVPLNNCRWLLFEKTEEGWKLKHVDKENRTREPSPLVTFHDGRLFLSANPTLTGPEEYDGESRPEILLFNTDDSQMPFERLLPVWSGQPPFTEHSYRSFAADGVRGELILFQNISYDRAEWTFRDALGKWSAQGQLWWPFGNDDEVAESIRICYPNVMLKDRAVYFCGVSDIIEPNEAWREYKKQLTGRDWDYDFRRLFFTWTDDITSSEFNPWIEVASREKTCGWISPADLWVSPEGAVHLLWTERAIDERLREKFFPGAKQSYALNYAIIRKGEIQTRRTLVLAEEGGSNEIPAAARFHITPENRLLVIFYVKGTNENEQPVNENRILELAPDGRPGKAFTLHMKQPLSSFFTATLRAGSQPSSVIDILGTPSDGKHSINYSRIRLW